MLNQAGVLVGVTTSKFNNADNIGFGIKHTDLLKELDSVNSGKKEIEMALKAQYIPVTLGQTRLRTETAAIVACHSVVFYNEQTN